MQPVQTTESSRAGRYVQPPSGYRAFIPAPLPPNPPLHMELELWELLSQADLSLGKLDGATDILPNPDLFVSMYVRQEAVLSAQIEGTQASLGDLLEFEARDSKRDAGLDVEEVVNYVQAMNYGLHRLTEFPLCLRLIRDIHAQLMKGARGREREPGEFRRSQNWIGAAGCNLNTASFVPPPPYEMNQMLANLEHFIHERRYPPLIRAGLVHAQFETIHPFLDGNGRIGRLLITFMLCEAGVLSRPLLYLSYYLKRNRDQYYEKLQAVRIAGAWEEWLFFFLNGIVEVAEQATIKARNILSLRKDQRAKVGDYGRANGNLLRALDYLFEQPLTTVGQLASRLDITATPAGSVIKRLVEVGILQETTGRRRNRQFRFEPYLALFTED